jgi:hypothetical protein
VNWPQGPTSRFQPTYRPCLLSFFVRLRPTWPISTAKFHSLPPRRGRSLTFTQKVPQRHICGPAGLSAGEGLGRPAVVPPAGTGRGLDARPCRGAGGRRKVGRFLRKRRGRAWTERTRSLPGGGQPRELGAFPGEPSLVQTRQGRGSEHGSPRRFDDGVDAAVCPRQFQKS